MIVILTSFSRWGSQADRETTRGDGDGNGDGGGRAETPLPCKPEARVSDLALSSQYPRCQMATGYYKKYIPEKHKTAGIVSRRRSRLFFALTTPFCGLCPSLSIWWCWWKRWWWWWFRRPADLDNPRHNSVIWDTPLRMAAAVKLVDRPSRFCFPRFASSFCSPCSTSCKWWSWCCDIKWDISGSGVRDIATPLIYSVGDLGMP